MDAFNFLPDTIKGNLRLAIYGLIIVHLLIFCIWIGLTIPSLFKPSSGFNKQIEDMIKKNKSKHE